MCLEVILIRKWQEWRAHLSMRRAIFVCGAILGTICIFYFVQPPSDGAPQMLYREQAQPESSDIEITGLSSAAQRVIIRNPFSLVHETAGEQIPAPIQEVRTQPSAAAPPVMVPAGAVKESPSPPSKEQMHSIEPRLCGVVADADGRRLIILTWEKESAVLGIGEEWRGYTVNMIAEDHAALHSAHGSVVLRRE